MALLVCVDCTARYSVGAPRCPQCQSTNHVEEGEDMPKVTVHGGPSNENDAEAAGGEESSLGNSSETSSEKPSSSPKTSKPEDQSPARTTANRSKKGQTASSSARATGGGQTGRTSGSADN